MMVDCNTRCRHAKQEHVAPVSGDAKSSERSAAEHQSMRLAEAGIRAYN